MKGRLELFWGQKEAIDCWTGSPQQYGVEGFMVFRIRGLLRGGCFDILLGYSFYESSSFNQT